MDHVLRTYPINQKKKESCKLFLYGVYSIQTLKSRIESRPDSYTADCRLKTQSKSRDEKRFAGKGLDTPLPPTQTPFHLLKKKKKKRN